MLNALVHLLAALGGLTEVRALIYCSEEGCCIPVSFSYLTHLKGITIIFYEHRSAHGVMSIASARRGGRASAEKRRNAGCARSAEEDDKRPPSLTPETEWDVTSRHALHTLIPLMYYLNAFGLFYTPKSLDTYCPSSHGKEQRRRNNV